MLDAIILCGGRGTRLASVVSDVPKPLAPVLEKPFLDYLLLHLAASGAVRSAILAVHHLAEKVITYYEGRTTPLPIQVVRESTPLGTGGAMMNSLAAVSGSTFLCFNGDSLCGGSLNALIAEHRRFGPGITLGLFKVPDSSRYGRVVCDRTGRIVEFTEKAAGGGPGFINAGVYVIDCDVLGAWDGAALSIERDVLPRLVSEGLVRGVSMAGPFLDIGLPETYAVATDFVLRLQEGQPAD